MKKATYLLALMLVFLPAIASAQFTINTPVDRSELGVWGEINSIAIQGDYAYVTDGKVGLHVVDITDPAMITEVGSFRTDGFSGKVVVEGDYAYVANTKRGLQVVDISDPESPSLTSEVTLNPEANDIAISGDYAYISGETGSLDIVNILEPDNPVHISSTVGYGAISSLKVDGDYVYLSGSSTLNEEDTQKGICIIDVSDPASPNQAADLFMGMPDVDVDIDVMDGFVYMGYGSDLMIVDVRNPNMPIGIFSMLSTFSVADIIFQDNYAFVVDLGGLMVLDIANPDRPVEAESFDTDVNYSQGAEVAVSGDYAYITDPYFGLKVVDISTLREDDREEDGQNGLSVRPDDAAELRTATLNAYPNPFNPLLTAAINLPDQSELRISLFNQLGQEVAVLADGSYSAGEQSFTLNASHMATGNYYLRAVGTGGQLAALYGRGRITRICLGSHRRNHVDS